MQVHAAHALCVEHMNKMVRVQMNDGAVYVGVIEKVDHEHVFLACPVQGEERDDARFFPYPGYGPGFWPGYGPYPRFRRFGLPLAGLAALSLFPFWI
jgi:hypothetical protein